MLVKHRQTARVPAEGHETYGDNVTTPTADNKRANAPTVLTIRSPVKRQQAAPNNNNNNNNNERPKEKSIYDMNVVEIADALKMRLFGQDETLERLAAVLYEFNQSEVLDTRRDDGTPAPLILPLMLAGVTGVGKTATAKRLKQLYQVGDAQYLKYDLTRITDDSQINIILGAGPGLIGSASRTTLPMALLRAVGRAPRGRFDVDVTEEMFQQQQLIDKANNQQEAPRTVLLHFDEVDKAHPKFLTLMLNFIEDGELTASNDVKFVLPQETRLIIVFTANYGEHEIEPLCQMRHYREAQQLVRACIEAHGVPRAVLGRLPHVLPYFQLEPLVMKKIGDCMVVAILSKRDHAYRALFSCITYDDDQGDGVTRVIDVIKSNYLFDDGGASLGMRGLDNGLKEFRALLYAGIANCLLRSQQQQQQQQQQPQPQNPTTIMIDLTAPLPVDIRQQRTTRSQSLRQQASPPSSVVVSRVAPTTPKPTPHLTYRQFSYPYDDLVTLRERSPDAFSRSVRCNIDERVHRGLDVGLVLVYNAKPQGVMVPTLLYCMLNERLSPAPSLALVTYPQPVQQPALLEQPTRRLLNAPRHARCPDCRRRHARTEACHNNTDNAMLVEEVEEEESEPMLEFSFDRICQFYTQPLLHNGDECKKATKKRRSSKK